MTADYIERPFSVTLAGLFVLVSALFSAVAGFLYLIGAVSNNDDWDYGLSGDWGDGTLVVAAIVAWLSALVMLFLASGIFRGNNFARFIVSIFALLALVNGVLHFPAGIGSIVVNLLLLFFMWKRSANIFFASR